MSKRLVRTVIYLDDKQKAWLDRQASLRRVSRASLIRQAVGEYQAKESRASEVSFQEALKQTAGIGVQMTALSIRCEFAGNGLEAWRDIYWTRLPCAPAGA